MNCTKFGQFILWKIIQIVATCRCHILTLKCTKFDFGWGSAPDHVGGSYNAPTDPLADRAEFMGLLLRREERTRAFSCFAIASVNIIIR